MTASSNGLELTVIVATRDRPEQLRSALTAIDVQRRRFPGLEVVVVDDGGVDAEAVEEIVRELPYARLVRQASGGVSKARNAGAGAARAQYVAFIDDDCEPGPGWAERLVRALRDGADAVAGPTVVGRRDDPLAQASQVVSNALVSRDAASSARTGFAPSSNIACRSDLFRAEPFSLRYTDAAAEDRDWCERIVDSGRTLVYDGGAIVYHYPQLDVRSFMRKHFRYGRGAYEYRRRHRDGRLEPPGFYARLLGDGFRAGAATGVCVCLAQLATAAGFVAETLSGRTR